jgi:predicted Zn-dependent protease
VEVAKQYPIYNNATVTAYVQAVGDRIVRNSDRKDIAYHFAVINKKEANAFALPGGYVYTYTELMKAAGDEAEFAAVVAHEIGHVAARHSTERLGVAQNNPAAGLASRLARRRSESDWRFPQFVDGSQRTLSGVQGRFRPRQSRPHGCRGICAGGRRRALGV